MAKPGRLSLYTICRLSSGGRRCHPLSRAIRIMLICTSPLTRVCCCPRCDCWRQGRPDDSSVLSSVRRHIGSSALGCLYLSARKMTGIIAGQVEAPDWTLVLWMWEKAKISSMARTGAPAASVLSARFAPGDSGIISVLGTNFLRMLRCVDGTLKTGVQPLSKRDPQEYLSQVCRSAHNLNYSMLCCCC